MFSRLTDFLLESQREAGKGARTPCFDKKENSFDMNETTEVYIEMQMNISNQC